MTGFRRVTRARTAGRGDWQMHSDIEPREKTARFDGTLKTTFFTICSWNFLAYALTLRESLFDANGYVDFYVAICDSRTGFDRLCLPFPVILLEDLGIPDLEEMTHRYNITELNTAIKPFVFRYLFENHPDAAVVYMDPDILVTSGLEELRAALAQGADCVLTPHILEPNEFATFDDRQMLLYGIYNLGFCALRATPAVERVVSWWGRRLEQHCVIDLPNGLFVDQKWADLLPAYIEKTRLLHHCGYNVAYWNLSQRRVWQTGEGWTVNGHPLRFFHFSGNRIAETSLFSRHSRDFAIPVGDAAKLFDRYAERVKSNGHLYYRSIPYAFSWNGRAGTNLHTPETEQAAPAKLSLLRPANRDAVVPHLPVARVKSLAEYNTWRSLMRDILDERVRREADSIPEGEAVFQLPGHCIVCGRESSFQVRSMYSSRTLPDGRRVPNWREHLDCLGCGFVNRVRAFLHILTQELRPAAGDRIYISEQATSTYSWLAGHFPNLVGSECLDGRPAPGTVVTGNPCGHGAAGAPIRHEDPQNLSFPNSSFDVVLSLDVLQHVPDYLKALREIHRCLDRGGFFLSSAPFCVDRQENLVMARTAEDGSLVHPRTPPEYYGNPVDPENGSLCFRYYGWQLLDDLVAAGFETAECWFYWSRQNVYLGEPQVVIAARKSDP
jgi:SAM-dependent methyltransferase